jgi:hypothetical protein
MRIPLQVAPGMLKPVPAGTLAQFSVLIMSVSWDSHRECRQRDRHGLSWGSLKKEAGAITVAT